MPAKKVFIVGGGNAGLSFAAQFLLCTILVTAIACIIQLLKK